MTPASGVTPERSVLDALDEGVRVLLDMASDDEAFGPRLAAPFLRADATLLRSLREALAEWIAAKHEVENVRLSVATKARMETASRALAVLLSGAPKGEE